MTKRRPNQNLREEGAVASGFEERRAITVARPADRNPAAFLIKVKAESGRIGY